MQKDTYASHRLTKQGLVITGSRTEISVPFQDLAVILRELCNALPSEPQESVAAAWSGSRSVELPIDPIQHQIWSGRPERK